MGDKTGEYWYEKIGPKILIEERLSGADSDIPRGFKFFVFHGEVEYIQVDYGRFTNHTRRFYDTEWNPQEFKLMYPLGPKTSKPTCLDEMIDTAEALRKDFDFIRVDLYQTESLDVKFGEMTLAPGESAERFNPKEYDFKLGSLW